MRNSCVKSFIQYHYHIAGSIDSLITINNNSTLRKQNAPITRIQHQKANKYFINISKLL